MSEILSKQQLKSKETKAKIFRAAKHILQKHGYEALSIKNICEEAGVSNGSFYHHFKTICFPTILKSSRILTQIFLIYQRVLMKLNLPLYMSTWIMCIIARNSALNLWRIIILRKTSLWTHWSVPNVRTRLWLYTIICRNVSVPESFPRIRILRISRQIFVWSLLEMFSNGAWKRGTQILREIWNVPWNLIWMESSNNWCCTKNTNVSKAFKHFIGNKHFVAVNFICRHKKNL